MPTFKSGSTAASFNTSVVVNLPVGTIDGNLLLACVVGKRGAPVVESGWTLIRRIVSGGTNNDINAIVKYKIASSEPASYSFDLSEANRINVGIACIETVDSSSPIHVNSGDTGDLAAPSITTTVPNTLLVYCGGSVGNADSSNWTPPTGMTEALEIVQLNAGLEMAYQVHSSVGATGTRTATASGSMDARGAFLVAIKGPTDITVSRNLAIPGSIGLSVPSSGSFSYAST